MGFLTGKKLLITGVISNRSIAYGIAEACHREGAELAFTYSDERFAERLKGFAAQFGSDIVLPMDVTKDDQIAAVVETLTEKWGGLDGFVHSIGYAPRESIAGGPGQGLPADDEGTQCVLPYADLSGRRARRSKLQHDGFGQGSA